ncbi:MAG: hypothetical protein AAF645_22950 [Myxococcota bacterium]
MTFRFALLSLTVALVGLATSARAQDDGSRSQVSFEPGKGVNFGTEDGRFGLGVSALFQVWGTLTDEQDAFGDRELSVGAEIRRAWFMVTGHAFGEHNRLVVQFGQASVPTGVFDEGPGFRLVDAFAEFTQLRDLEFRAGLMLLPFLREWVTPAANLAAPERSAAARRWHLGRRFGVALGSQDFLGLGRIRYRLGAFLGEFRAASPAAVGVMARVDTTLLGDPDLTLATDLARSPSPRLVLGGAFAYLVNEDSVAGFDDAQDAQQATVDLLFRIHGLSLEGAFMWRGGDSGTFLGGTAMATYMLPVVDVGVAFRYAFSDIPFFAASGSEQEFTGSVNYFVAGLDAFKLQLAFSAFVPDEGETRYVGTVAVQAQL